MAKYNVEYKTDVQEGVLLIVAKIENAPAKLMEYLECRVDNYYDANGLNQIEVSDNTLSMFFNVETDEEVKDTIDNVGSYIDFVLGCLDRNIARY